MAAPPAATRRWKSTCASLTLPPGVTPSKVAALMMRLRSVRGPSRAGAKTAGGWDGADGEDGAERAVVWRVVRGIRLPLPTARGRRHQHGPQRRAAHPAVERALGGCRGRPAGRVADHEDPEQAASRAGGGTDVDGGAEPRGELRRTERGGAGEAGEQRQDGDGEEAGGA